MIITAQQLNELLTTEQLIVIDVSHKEAPFTTGREVYEQEHIPGAIFLDIKEDLTGKNSFVPNLVELAEKLGKLGVTNEHKIVLYDRGTNRQVSKAFLVFTYLGHKQLTILQGGFNEWKEAGYEVTSQIPSYETATYEPNPNEQIVLNIDDIKARMDDKTSTLIDSRAYDRYTGEKEPKYKKAGHIPGAKNYFSRDVLDDNLWKDASKLKEHFDRIDEEQEVIVSCGSGNSACLNFVALKAAGYDNVKIYPGGFSEWIEDDDNEVSTKDE